MNKVKCLESRMKPLEFINYSTQESSGIPKTHLGELTETSNCISIVSQATKTDVVYRSSGTMSYNIVLI